jgi:hypothetical protein
MGEDRCQHDLLAGQCADCAPTPVGLPARVFRTAGGTVFHRTRNCGGLRDGQRYAARLGMTTHPVELVALNDVRDRLGACEVCFLDAG